MIICSSDVNLHDRQKEIVKQIIKSKALYYTIVCPRQWGKEQPIYSKVYCENNTKTFKNLQVGDKIYGADGKLTTIISITDNGLKDIYRVSFADGRYVDCGLEHLWEVNYKRRTKNEVLTTDEIIKRGIYSERKKYGKKLYKDFNFYINNCEPVNYTKKDYIIPPYLLGLLIGDGSLHTGITLTTADPEVFNYFNIDYSIKKLKNKYEYSITNIKGKSNIYLDEIRRLNLNVKSIDKFIPNEYKYGSIEQRLELLRGLMDTDGTSSYGKTEYYTISSQLADDICDLVYSLGGSAKKLIKKGRYKNKEHKSFRIVINLNMSIFNLERKKQTENLNKKYDKSKRNAIVDISLIDKEFCRCIMVDNNTSLYLTDNYIITHNSLLLSQLCLYHSINHNNSVSMVCSPVYSQSKKIFKEICKAIRETPIVKNINNSDLEIELSNESIIKFRSVMKADNLRGETLSYLYCDEAALYNNTVFDEVLRNFLKIKGKRCFLFSTPKGKNWFYKMFKMADTNPRYMSFRGQIGDNPYDNKDEVEDARKTLPELIFRQEYEGEFIEDGGECFVNVNACSLLYQYPRFNEDIKYYAGIDIGRADDFTVLTIMGSDGLIYDMMRTNKKDYHTIVDDMVNILRRYNPIETLIEINGVGDAIYDMLYSKYKRITAWRTTNESKQQIIEELVLAFQDQNIVIPAKTLNPVLHEEINDFSFTWSKKTRKITYGARTGHDDTIISLSLANHARKHYANKGSYTII
jgi:hypothetical protein